MMRFLLLLVFLTRAELVIVNGNEIENRLILTNGRNPCEGVVKIYHGNQWGFVGDKFWNSSTEAVVCRSIRCGEPVRGPTETTDIPEGGLIWLNELKCGGNESQLWGCEHPGWNISVYLKNTVRKVKCSNTVQIKLDGSKCAGAVRYSNNGTSPSGYICDENWGEKEASFLCEKLGCGKSKEIPKQQWMVWKEFEKSEKMRIKCLGISENEEDLWQCVFKESSTCQNPASVICQEHERLQLTNDPSNACSGRLETEKGGKWQNADNLKNTSDQWCQQMHCGTKVSHSEDSGGIQLKCSEQVKVVLMDNNKRSDCYGEVHIEVNNHTFSVCASTWDRKEGDLVCKELNCGNLIAVEKKKTTTGIMDYVDCSGSESSLWHCRGKRHKNLFPCSSSAYVVCEGSVNVTLMDGPGRCAGRVEILHEGHWKRVSIKGWTKENSNAVCKQLHCGENTKNANGEKFIKGTSEFFPKTLSCSENAMNISGCFNGNSNNQLTNSDKEQLVELTCTDHKMLLLLGDCSGMVSIVQDGETYWLSGSNETWNENTANLVCQQKHCGVAVNFTAENFTSVQDAEKKLLTASLCPRDAESLFDCLELNTMSPDLNATVASVTCSGKINITLSRGCWGVVTICMGGACGGVFADTWTMDQSQMLCKNLGCGEKALEAAKDSKDVMMFKSLHSTKHITQLSQSNFLKCNNSKGMCYSNPAYVVCSGSVKPRLSNSRDKCMGNVELSYEDSWLPVSNVLKEKEIRTLCKELNCGNGGELMGYFGQKPENRPTSLVCPTNHKGSLRECDISRSNTTNSKVTGLKCSKWRKMKVSGPCGGEVFVETDGNKSPVSSEGWNKTEGKSLCEDLGCPTSDVKIHSRDASGTSLWNRSFSCKDRTNEINIWGCEKEDPPTQKAQKLLIECKDVPVSLSQTCSGVVKINELEVCSTGWKTMYSHLVCQERNCSNAVVGAESFHAPMANKEYYHVRCDYGEDRLGQCERVKGRCNDKLVSVYCVGGVQFRTAHICGGFIEVKYQDKWEKICPINLKPHTMDDLCKRMNCHSQIKGMKTSESNVLLNMKTSLDCTEGCMDARHCVRAKGCEKVRPAEIFCEGYQPPEPPQPPSTPTPVLSIILGVGFFLVLVILIVVFVRICLAKRARKAMKLPARMMSHKDVEFESGDYEDVKANEMEDFSRGRFRSESEVILDSDGRSVSSFHYDDVDEAVDTQPLTSQGSVTGASGDNHLHEDALESNKATYEVDDPQESYDDIEAGSEITQTEAEVHKNHQPPPESDSLPPPDLVQGDDDYLVPDQHG